MISDEDLTVRLTDLDVRAAGLEQELEALGQEVDDGERLLMWEERRKQLHEWLVGLAQPLSVAEVGQSPELQRDLLLRVVDKVWVDAKGNIEIEGVVNLPAPKAPRRVWVPKGRTIGQASVGTGGGSRHAGKEGGSRVQEPAGPRRG